MKEKVVFFVCEKLLVMCANFIYFGGYLIKDPSGLCESHSLAFMLF